MTRALLLLLLVSAAVGAPRPAAAQATIKDDLTGLTFDPARCVVTATAAPVIDPDAPPVTWRDFEIIGQLVDDSDVVRSLFEPTMNRHRALTAAARADIERVSAAFGYHLVDLRTREGPAGTLAVIQLSPLQVVRGVRVDVDTRWTGTVLDDEVRRRMRVRTGTYLPWAPQDRACELLEETRRLEDFLRDEGYFEARVALGQELRGKGVEIRVVVRLGQEYVAGKITVTGSVGSGIGDEAIRATFRHTATCLVRGVCIGTARFRRAEHQKDIQEVVRAFHKQGYPAVRVRTDFDPKTSFDRRTRTVPFSVIIDLRRQLDIVFEGHSDAIRTEDLLDQLTFNVASSSDDVEANASARALTAYLQGRGFFDARVTWTRERFERFDRLIYRIDQGSLRPVRMVSFRGNRRFTDADLQGAIAIRQAKLSTTLLGNQASATSEQLAGDVERLVSLYRRAGYREARVRVEAATSELALGSAALTAGVLIAERGDGLYVRYTIDEGLPTLLTQVVIELGGAEDAFATPENAALCSIVLGELAGFYGEPQLATSAVPGHCVGFAPNLAYREADATDTRDRLRDRLFSRGRPRARVALDARANGPHRIAVHYDLSDVQALRIGTVVIRGNFRTSTRVIQELLGFAPGTPLTQDVLADASRKLRNTGLFDGVNIALPDLDTISAGEVNAVVEVVERYDFRALIETELGHSSFNGTFVKLLPSFRNLFGRGISLDLNGTVGIATDEFLASSDLRLRQLAAEATLRFPRWLSGAAGLGLVPEWLEFQTELTAFRRRQDTPRFGLLTTDGATLALTRSWSEPRTAKRSAYAITVGLQYDFRLRERLVDVLRPSGADDDQTQVPVSTRTGAIGVRAELERRVDRSGALSPLAPEAGYRLEGQASIAAPWLAGQATFVKLSAAGTRFWPIGDNLVIRADGRYDQGIPLAGAVLLPEVERFFAGGDTTVRGYEDDRLATEIISVGVPPLDNVQQLRILPSGGNIRAMASLDAQLRIYKVFATAAFVDAGLITNQWGTVTEDDIRPSIGIALFRIVTPFGIGALERAMPLQPQLGDNPRGRWHLSFAARAQF